MGVVMLVIVGVLVHVSVGLAVSVAEAVLDPSWLDLIDGAWDGRPDPARKVKEPPDLQDFEKTLKFVEYIINESRLYIARNNPA